MVTKSLIFYALAVLVGVLSFVGVSFAFKLRKRKLMPLHILFGALGFILMLVLMFMLIMFAFSHSSTTYMSELMPEFIYKLCVVILFFAAISAVRYFILNAVYFNREKVDEGESFLAGYGLCGCILVTVYSLFMFIMLLTTSMRTTLTSFDSSALYFADGSVISSFASPLSVALVSVVFIVYTALCIIIAEFMTQHATLPYSKKSTLIVYLITALCEHIMISVFLLAAKSTVAVVIVSVIMVLLAGLAVALLYKYKEELPYNKQFE